MPLAAPLASKPLDSQATGPGVPQVLGKMEGNYKKLNAPNYHSTRSIYFLSKIR
ncbi:hypothetical protein TIFTF001_030558 [Ficus carica]|uniref:Uncharacterized protein n=1 Tax=Ficus carica TaxID=3494 RepID=A0AA88DTL8_FICCA|nr:hypothetical protein TIFTF001_030558 [Ficus carica]